MYYRLSFLILFKNKLTTNHPSLLSAGVGVMRKLVYSYGCDMPPEYFTGNWRKKIIIIKRQECLADIKLGTRVKIDFECQIPVEFSTWPKKKKAALEYPSGTRGVIGPEYRNQTVRGKIFADLRCGTESNRAVGARIPAYPECIA